MKPYIYLLCLFAILANSARLHAAPHPNVVIIYGDDVGYGDVGAYGAKLIPTPNIDRLAAQGLRFTDAHCAAATCTPSRYSLLTGEMAFRKKGTGILPGNAKMAIDPDQFTLADVFQKAGYRTGVIGKWHLGLGDGAIDWNGEIKPGPREIGFDYCFLLPATNDRVPCVYLENYRVINLDPKDPITVSYGKPVADDASGTAYPDGRKTPEAMTYYPSSHGHNNSVVNGIGRIGFMKGGKSALWNDEQMADVFVEKTRDFIKKNKYKPFFLFFSSQDIHVPRVPHPRFHGKSKLSYRGDAMVQLDWSTGEILKALQENGLAENTLVIFSSDNGPVYDDGYQDGTTVRTSTGEVDRGHDGSGPYRGGKYQIYEGGTRVPFVVRWPAKIKPGVSGALVSQVDLLASIASLVDVSVPAGAARDSRNHLDALLGADTAGADAILEQAGPVALRQGDWKFIETTPRPKRRPGRKSQPAPKPRQELYNLKTDPSESENVAADHPDRVAEMSARLRTLRTKGLAE